VVLVLEFVITLGLCSAWPPIQDKCVFVAQHEMEFETKAQCALYSKLLADLIPLSVEYPIKVWVCNLRGENVKR